MKNKKYFIIQTIFIKYLYSNNIIVKIMVNYNNILKFSKGDILKITAEYCKLIDDYGFNFYLKEYWENIKGSNKKYALVKD